MWFVLARGKKKIQESNADVVVTMALRRFVRLSSD